MVTYVQISLPTNWRDRPGKTCDSSVSPGLGTERAPPQSQCRPTKGAFSLRSLETLGHAQCRQPVPSPTIFQPSDALSLWRSQVLLSFSISRSPLPPQPLSSNNRSIKLVSARKWTQALCRSCQRAGDAAPLRVTSEGAWSAESRPERGRGSFKKQPANCEEAPGRQAGARSLLELRHRP